MLGTDINEEVFENEEDIHIVSGIFVINSIVLDSISNEIGRKKKLYCGKSCVLDLIGKNVDARNIGLILKSRKHAHTQAHLHTHIHTCTHT